MLILYSVDQAFGLPSYDPDCLMVQAYLDLLDTDWQLVIDNSLVETITDIKPVLSHHGQFIKGPFRIFEYLNQQGYKLKNELNNKDQAKVYSLSMYFYTKLTDIMLFYRYLESNNYQNTTIPTLCQLLPFTSKYTTPKYLQNLVFNKLDKYRINNSKKEEQRKQDLVSSKLAKRYFNKIKDDKLCDSAEFKLFDELKIICNQLKEMLIENGSDQPKCYLYNNQLSLLDLVVSSLLSHLVYPPYPTNLSGQHILTHPTLTNYLDTIKLNQFTPLLSKSSIQASPNPFLFKAFINSIKSIFTPFLLNIKEQEPSNVSQEVHQASVQLRKNRAYSAISAVVAMSGYIIYHGLLASGEEQQYQNEENDQNQEEVIEIDVEE